MAAEATTTTTVAQQIVNPTPTVPINGETASVIGGGILALAGFLLVLRKKASAVGLDVTKDRQEGLMLKESREDRDKAMKEAREAWDQRASDAALIGELKGEVRYLTGINASFKEENEMLRKELTDAREHMAQIRLNVQSTGQIVDRAKTKLDTAEKRARESGAAPLGKE